jgi:putative peptide maturation dehydrogenase
MRLRRCHALLIEPRETRELDIAAVFAGEARMRSRIEWRGLAAHRDDCVTLSDAEVLALGEVSSTDWTEGEDFVRKHGEAVVRRLLDNGLLETEDAPDAGDAIVREGHWHRIAAVAHRHLRWQDTDTQKTTEALAGDSSLPPMLERLGPPPPPVAPRVDAARRQPLPASPETGFDRLLSRRVTCRNFDPARPLPLAMLATILQQVHGARATAEVTGVPLLKKAVPSAGGLHPVEAWLLVRRVDGLAPGLYHYHSTDHALEPMRALDAEEADGLALRFVAGQTWFAQAPVYVMLVARFQRNFWKYRGHAKAYRAVILDAGHLSQAQYQLATELGLGAFITAAANEGEIERALGLEPMRDGVLAVTGFGYRAGEMVDLEFDPLQAVWPAPA